MCAQQCCSELNKAIKKFHGHHRDNYVHPTSHDGQKSSNQASLN
uniref:Uncharacterized protein n=1 Tax=Arundo donax TaxID=35708 RepID=A0A0A9H184_ARUDO